MPRTSKFSVGISVIAMSLMGMLTLTSCSASGASVSSATASATASDGASPTASASSLPSNVLHARRVFDHANQALAASNSNASDQDIVAALVRAGFSKEVMQITTDTTTIGRRVDSIEVSVRVGDDCLLGEFRGSSYASTTASVLSGNRCLVGATRSIDW